MQYHVEKCAATRREVCDALAWVARNRPELRDTMRVAIAMLGHLDTLRSEGKFNAWAARGWIRHPDAPDALKTAEANLDGAIEMLGNFGDTYPLYIQ